MVNYLDDNYVSVYVPTTPNPTSGFFLMLPKSEVIELDMDVDEALKYIISMGVVAPPPRKKETLPSSRHSTRVTTETACELIIADTSIHPPLVRK